MPEVPAVLASSEACRRLTTPQHDLETCKCLQKMWGMPDRDDVSLTCCFGKIMEKVIGEHVFPCARRKVALEPSDMRGVNMSQHETTL